MELQKKKRTGRWAGMTALLLAVATGLTALTGAWAVDLNRGSGDVNQDGKVSSLDALWILEHVSGLRQLEGDSAKAADLNGDGKIASFDALSVLNKVVGMAVYNCRPAATGDFIQSWYCYSWDEAKWESHMDMLKSAGIDKLIIQSTADIDENGNFGLVLYDSPYIRAKNQEDGGNKLLIVPDSLENLFKAAQAKGVKIFVGLNAPEAWWDVDNMRDEAWYTEQATIANEMAKEIYDLYKTKYPDALYGWYWWPEMYTQTDNLEGYWADMFNISLDYFTKLDPSMPALFSPFVSSYYENTPEETKAEWINFMQKTRFRKGDIFCPQDSVGASGIPIDELERQLIAQYEASKYNENVIFWVNIENFTKGGGSASITRFKQQLNIAAQYAENIITFSYSHYYDPNYRNSRYDRQYKEYLKTLGD